MKREHKQKYWKRENKKINKKEYKEITGNRTELKNFLNKELYVEAFVTNTIAYDGTKRLITEIKIGNYFIKHVWMDIENTGNFKHGYQKIKVKVKEYKNYITNENKYGLSCVDERGKMYVNTKIKKPKWKK